MTPTQYRPLHALVQRIASTPAGAWFMARVSPPADRLWLKLSGGRATLAGALAGVPVILVNTTGARSGRPRRSPLLPVRDPSEPAVFALIASNFGQHPYPAWYFNLKASPRATCTVDGNTRSYIAHEATGAEYARFWEYATNIYPGYAAYGQRAGRRIPIMVMRPEQ